MEKRGIRTDKGEVNRQIAADNKLLKEIKARITPVSYTHLDVYKRQTGFDICAEGFKTGTVFNFRHITSPSYIV